MPSRLWSGFACLELSISAKAEGGLSLCKTMTIRRLSLFTFAAPAKRSRSPRNSTIHFIRKPTAFATRSRITAGACAHIASYGDAMATALTVNITLLETSPLWISLSQMAAAPLATIFPTAVNLWRKSSPIVCCWSSFLPDCVSSIRMLIPSFSAGLMITRSQIVQSLKSSVARSVPSLIR